MTDLGVPAPPRGPGVAPPFAAPPTDRNRRGLWIGLGVGALVLLLCGIGGVVGIVVLGKAATDQAKREGTTVVTAYLDALRSGQFATANAQLCTRLARELTASRLAADFRARPFTGYRLDEPVLSDAVEVTAHLDTTAGVVDRTYVVRGQNEAFKICAIR